MTETQKYSVTRLFYGDLLQESPLPLELQPHLYVASVAGLFREDNFSLWRAHVPKDRLEFFEKADIALVHNFTSDHMIGKNEEDSKELLHEAFVCLRVVKPTRTPFSVVQYRQTDDRKVDVFSFIEPEDPITMNLPESEVLNRLNAKDLLELRRLLPEFTRIRAKGPQNVRRAIRYYETGYAVLKEADLQFTVWMTGIESLFSFGDDPVSEQTIKSRILDSVGSNTDIYAEFEDRDLYVSEPVVLKDVLDPMFELRHRLVHGAWAPSSWLHTRMRNAISGGPITLADVTREAASFVLRAGLKKKLRNQL